MQGLSADVLRHAPTDMPDSELYQLWVLSAKAQRAALEFARGALRLHHYFRVLQRASH